MALGEKTGGVMDVCHNRVAGDQSSAELKDVTAMTNKARKPTSSGDNSLAFTWIFSERASSQCNLVSGSGHEESITIAGKGVVPDALLVERDEIVS